VAYQLNVVLRERETVRPWFPFIKLLMRGLQALPTVSAAVTWRGVKEDLSRSFRVGKKYFDWAVVSTSTDGATVQQFLGDDGPRTLIRVQGVTGVDIEKLSAFQESEIVFKPGTRFEVKSVIQTGTLTVVEIHEQTAAPADMFDGELTNGMCDRIASGDITSFVSLGTPAIDAVRRLSDALKAPACRLLTLKFVPLCHHRAHPCHLLLYAHPPPLVKTGGSMEGSNRKLNTALKHGGLQPRGQRPGLRGRHCDRRGPQSELYDQVHQVRPSSLVTPHCVLLLWQ
jgi:hypothetical protein